MSNRHSKDTRIFVKDIAKLFFDRNLSDQSYRAHVRNELITKESAIGAAIFGLKNSENERNEFFFDGRDKNGINSWFFHQDKIDPISGNHDSRTLHYEILPAGVLLVGTGYLQGEELSKFITATKMYHRRVMDQIYLNSDPMGSLPRSNQNASKIGRLIRSVFRNNNNDQLAA
jgi:hypothetical protein